MASTERQSDPVPRSRPPAPERSPLHPDQNGITSDGHQTQTNDQRQAADRQVPTSEVPEHPALAPNIVMSGEMEESGFAEPQWMVQRDGQFIHLTELLYQVAKQVDGKRSLDEIAAAMSEEIDRIVSADNVRQLIGTKLIPLGVVVGADGKVVGADAAGEGAVRSPLKINMKTKVLPRGLITPLTKVLKILFFPPILIAMLLVCFAAQGWLFFVHGIGGSIHEAVYKPWLTLVILGIIVVGTAWHEFGHAAALEYGGGEVRGMGAGFYLVYPAFYTDVTDNYRLGRWARVRTDLGGFYFNLIFCLGLIGLFFLTRQPFLLLGVLLIDVDIIHQCLPFVRLDGYWTLADITGIPDFFSYMGPFLRSVLPLKKKEGDDKLPAFKRWVKVVFAIYIIVTIPILAFLLFAMLKNVPRILATAWDSFGKQWSALTAAASGGHYGGVALAVLQILLLALPVAGLGFALFSLGRTAMRLLWNWARPTPGRRVVGSLATAAIVALLAYLWIPNLSLGGGKSASVAAQSGNWAPIRADERGTIADAAPQVIPLPFRSPVTEPAATAVATSVPVGTQPASETITPAAGTPGVTTTPSAAPSGTPSGTVTATASASATPGATPSGTPTASTPTAAPATVVPAAIALTPVPVTSPAQAPASGSVSAPTALVPSLPPTAGTTTPAVLTPVPTIAASGTSVTQGTSAGTAAPTSQLGAATGVPTGSIPTSSIATSTPRPTLAPTIVPTVAPTVTPTPSR